MSTSVVNADFLWRHQTCLTNYNGLLPDLATIFEVGSGQRGVIQLGMFVLPYGKWKYQALLLEVSSRGKVLYECGTALGIYYT
jgi:hypothetical protein